MVIRKVARIAANVIVKSVRLTREVARRRQSCFGKLNAKNGEVHNMKFKPLRSFQSVDSDVPLQAPFANGFAILSLTIPSVSRCLTRCYVP